MKKVYLLLMGLLAANWSFGQACTSTIAITPTAPYSQNFDNTTHGWVASGTNSSWALGTPNKNVITGTGSGTNAWVTGGLGTSTYNASENSQVVSPCFNMTALVLPVVELKIFWDSEASWDGAVLQYQVNNGAWTTIGAVGDPNNWYNDASLDGRVGGGSIGWAGRNAPGWVTAKHTLPAALAGQTNVRFRIAFGSDTSVQYDGFAFDDFSIYETPANDVGVTAVLAPISGCGLSATSQVQVKIKNFGSAAQTNFPVSFNVTGPTASSGTATYTGPAIAPNTEVTFTFPAGQTANLATPGTYTVTAQTNLTTDNLAFNNASTTTVTAIPSFTLTQGPSAPAYFQNFENTSHGWTVGGTASSWTLGTPAKAVINSAGSGANSWVTGLTGTHNANEKSFVKSPCFNMSSLGAPVIEMLVWWNSEFSNDGAVLQSSINGGATWQNVGTFNDPIGINWYNDNTIAGAPGDQAAATAVGWTGRASTNNGSGGWVMVKRDLSGLGGQSSVILRVAFGANGFTQVDGFAFDDVKIYDKPAKDMAALRFVQPISGCGLSNSEMVAMEIRNEGSQPQVNFPITYTYTNTTTGVTVPVTETYTDTIDPGQTVFHIFNTAANLSARTIFNFEGWVGLAGEAPVNRANDTISGYEVSNAMGMPTNTTPYVQDFEQNKGGWTAGGQLSSWEFGTPMKNVIIGAASGNNAWVTGGLGTEAHNSNEKSFVKSPCMNFSNITNPVIEMKVWWQSEFNKDGAVLQASTDDVNWVNIPGSFTAVNWYNSNNITGNPGGSAEGWSGAGAAANGGGSGGWVTVKADLRTGTSAASSLGGKPLVYLRVAFGADASTELDGFGFDDVRIYNRVNNDLAIESIRPIVRTCGLTNCEKFRVLVRNNGLNQVASFDLTYNLNNGTAPVTENFNLGNNPLNVGDTLTVRFNSCANLSTPGSYNVNITSNYTLDQLAFNNSVSRTFTNSLYTVLPTGITFEAGPNAIRELSTSAGANAAIAVNSIAANNSGFGLFMEGGATTPWIVPTGTANPWIVNLDHLAAASLCLRPTLPIDSLELSFDLRQIFKTTPSNTSFRVRVNGTQVGPTFQPANAAASALYNTHTFMLKAPLFTGTNPTVQIVFESNVRERYNGGTGTANFVDNIFIRGFRNGQPVGLKDEFAKGIAVYPNPSADIFKVEVAKTKNFTVEVMDLSGRTVQKLNGNGAEIVNLDMSKQAKGVYLMKVVSAEGNVATRKLILQ